MKDNYDPGQINVSSFTLLSLAVLLDILFLNQFSFRVRVDYNLYHSRFIFNHNKRVFDAACIAYTSRLLKMQTCFVQKF